MITDGCLGLDPFGSRVMPSLLTFQELGLKSIVAFQGLGLQETLVSSFALVGFR